MYDNKCTREHAKRQISSALPMQKADLDKLGGIKLKKTRKGKSKYIEEEGKTYSTTSVLPKNSQWKL